MSVLPLTLSGVRLNIGHSAVLRDIEHTFDGPSLTVLLGHNGAGKTMLLKLCHGLVAPTAGEVVWRDPVRAHRPESQAMVFQRPVLLRRTVWDNLLHVLRACRFSRTERGRRARQGLELGGLTDLARRPARSLSGGEQQRLALARAWAVRPEILILDEPCTYLDPGATQEVERIITEFYAAGTKIIMATHDLRQARRLADEIVFVHQGTIVEAGAADDFFSGPSSAEGQAFIDGRLATGGDCHRPRHAGASIQPE